jgi:putative hydrolase of the HAD superfamily
VHGAEDALKAHFHHTCCLATNAGESDEEAVKKGLARVGADAYFAFIFCSRDLGFKKPDPRFFQAILAKLQSAAENCIMIGDNYDKDIAGAKSAGLRTILYSAAGHDRVYPLADAVIRSMFELPDIVKKL